MIDARDRLRIVSHFPGRLRVRSDAFRIRPEIAQAIAQRVAEEPGVLEARTSAITGSLVVRYEPRTVELPALVKVLVRAGGLRGLEMDAGHDAEGPAPGGRVRDALATIDDKARAQTNGQLDIRVAVPGALATGGLAMFLLGRRRIPEWYDLLFWGFVTFVNLNPSAATSSDERRGPSLSRVGSP